LGEDYELVQYHLEHHMLNKNPTTIDALHEELNICSERVCHKFVQANVPGNSSDNTFSCNREGGDKAIYAGGSFKGACRECGMIGYKVADWRSSGNKSSGKHGSKAPPMQHQPQVLLSQVKVQEELPVLLFKAHGTIDNIPVRIQVEYW
jgi:hypothetical protein